ncbi:MAG: YdeI/OmpD-associated family protein [Patescibacteria group bacterium]
MPKFMVHALKGAKLVDAYNARPPYQQNDYIGWIMQPKRDETKLKRLQQMLDELKKGDRYMKMSYRAKE